MRKKIQNDTSLDRDPAATNPSNKRKKIQETPTEKIQEDTMLKTNPSRASFLHRAQEKDPNKTPHQRESQNHPTFRVVGDDVAPAETRPLFDRA
jgi:hypothetical protein